MGHLPTIFRLLLAALSLLGLAFAAPPPPPPPPTPPIQPAQTPPAGVPAARQADHLVVIAVDGPLDAFMTSSIERRLAAARRLGADAVVLEFDAERASFGTVGEALTVLNNSPVSHTVAWVRSRATGGAGLLALSCREIVVTDVGRLGAFIEPRWLNRGFSRSRGRSAAPSLAAAQNAAGALSSALDAARARGRDEFLIQALAIPGVELWLVQNPATGERRCVNEAEFALLFPNLPPRANPELSPGESLPPLAAALNNLTSSAHPPAPVQGANPPWPASSAADAILGGLGRADLLRPSARAPITSADAGRWTLITYATAPEAPSTIHGDQCVKYGVADGIVRTEAELTAFFGAKSITRLEQSWADHLARFLDHPAVKGVLIAIFLIAMFVEMTHPGLVIPGLVAVAMLILILTPAFIVGVAAWWSLVAIAMGVILLSMEIFIIPGFGVAGILGLLSLFVGLVFTFLPDGPAGAAFSTPEAQNALLRGVVTVLLSSLTAFFGLFFIIRQLGTIPILRRYTLQTPAPGEVDESIFGPMRPDDSAAVSVGEVGVAATPLRPAGKARFGAEYLDVVAEGGYVQEGVSVKVVQADRFRVVVIPADAPPPARLG